MKILKIMARVLSIGVLVNFTHLAEAEMGPQVSPDKKIIAFAPDTVDTVYLRENIKEMEQLPIDGMIISVFPDKWDNWWLSKRKRNQLWFGGMKFTREDFKQVIADLKATKFRRFTDNFIDTSIARWDSGGFTGFDYHIGRTRPGTAPEKRDVFPSPDWFSDEDWSRVIQNMEVATFIAKECKLKGIMLDWEQYGGGSGPWALPFNYRNYSDYVKKEGGTPKNFAECKTKLRQRGKELIQAITKVYPDITILFIPNCGVWFGTGDENDRDGAGLVPDFFDGMIESADERATLIDGGEGGYSRMKYKSFLALRQYAERLIPGRSLVPSLYAKRVRYVLGLFIDIKSGYYEQGFYNGSITGEWWRTTNLDKNPISPKELEHSLYNALTASDRYVWLFAWNNAIWWNPSLRGKSFDNGKAIYPHIPKEYIEAIKDSRKPHDLDWTPLKADKGVYKSAKEKPGYDDESTFSSLWGKYDLIMDLPKTWQFQFDEENFGYDMGWNEELSLPRGGPDIGRNESDWKPIQIGEWWENQGYPYDGAGWYRIKIKVPKEAEGRKLFLSFGGVAGSFSAWIWNKEKSGTLLPWRGVNDWEQKLMNERFEVNVTDLIIPGEENLISVRVHNYKGPGGIWKSVKLIALK